MVELYNPSAVRALLSQYGLRPQKALGQNFIVNPTVCPRIAEGGGARPGVGALEIGPGVGVLTRELAKRCEKVVAIELDRGLLPLLGETLGEFANAEVVHGDVLKLDLPSLVRERFGDMPVVVCANLPYYITTPVLMGLLESGIAFESITVMVQKETARRFCAPLPSREAGAVTMAIAYRAACRILFEVSRGCFLPPPNVDSAVIKLTPHQKPPVDVIDQAMLFAVIRAAFSQRRKTLLNCISSAFNLPKAEVSELLTGVQVASTARGEQLDLADIARIADTLTQKGTAPEA
ncbi:MAG: 16S rRNA (adenine(1518)-N(6)/adenine(1519)-N(6))-dimethyltransferase RsmA [Oscillospiraceae bacterium]|nr:16S rRNA (adenine(1518)-N(6)/adenine(1519)-N(6))-dimethyltransferase RsmA [Oscillospiraceae bacterium]